MDTSHEKARVRVLYSFPHKLGADRICYTAWQQVRGLAKAGADIVVFPGALAKPLPTGVRVLPTLSRGRMRIPYKLLGTMRACALHDWIVSRRLSQMVGKIDIIHTWPIGAWRTLEMATRLGIPTVLERPNAHTRFAYEAVQRECAQLGINLPTDHEHAFKPAVLVKEEMEYRAADRLLCPSDFVAHTFVERGFSEDKLARHQYGYDEKVFYPDERQDTSCSGLTILFAGGCAPRKGLHYALQAWLESPAHFRGTFLIAGQFVAAYAERLSAMLSDPSIKVLGHRSDIPELMRKSDILVLPSIEEGSALVTSEARGSGCVLLVSDASGAICKDGRDALVHRVGDVATLTRQITKLDDDRQLLEQLRATSLCSVGEITWAAAGKRLLDIYRETIDSYSSSARCYEIAVSRTSA
jgi:glycosyltransferase involved in cell wall biosynthesis